MENVESTSSVTPETSADSADTQGTEENETQGQATAPKTKEAKPKASKSEELTEEEYEEIALGQVKGKVPKTVAKAIKDYERGIQNKFREVADVKKQAQEFQKFAKENPREFMKQLGIDPYEFAEATLAEKIEMMEMTPEQKELRELKSWKEQQEKAEKEAREAAEKKKQEEEYETESKKFNETFVKAWESSGLPPHRYFGQLMAATMLSSQKRGEDLQPDQAALKVKEAFLSTVGEIVSQLDPEGIRSLIGDKKLKELRDAEVRRVTEKTAPTANSSGRPEQGSATKPRNTPKKPMSEKEFRQWIESHKQ